MKDLWTHLKETSKPIVLYGTGDGADKIIRKLKEDGTFSKVQGIFASSGFVRDRSFYDFKVESYEQCRDRLGKDMIVLMCFGSSRPEVLSNVYSIASECEFYAPDVPVYGKNIFDTAFYEAHKDEIDRATALLADELSVKTMINTVTNKLTGALEPLQACETTEAESDGLLTLPEGSVYLDLGAYNGDTVLKYTSLFPQINKVIAVEPDRRNFRKLGENTSHIKDITLVRAMISDTSGTSFADNKKGRGVHESSDAGEAVDTVTIDDLLDGGRVDLIKFDVEGNELKALDGGMETIKKYRPRMQIACYHRSEDIFTLPLKIITEVPSYKIYMRHLPHIPGWDTQFYFV